MELAVLAFFAFVAAIAGGALRNSYRNLKFGGSVTMFRVILYPFGISLGVSLMILLTCGPELAVQVSAVWSWFSNDVLPRVWPAT